MSLTRKAAEAFLTRRDRFILGRPSIIKTEDIFIGEGPNFDIKNSCACCDPLYFGRLKQLVYLGFDRKEVPFLKKQLRIDFPFRAPPTEAEIRKHLGHASARSRSAKQTPKEIENSLVSEALSNEFDATKIPDIDPNAPIDSLGEIEVMVRTSGARVRAKLKAGVDSDIRLDIKEHANLVKIYEEACQTFPDNDTNKESRALHAICEAFNWIRKSIDGDEGIEIINELALLVESRLQHEGQLNGPNI